MPSEGRALLPKLLSRRSNAHLTAGSARISSACSIALNCPAVLCATYLAIAATVGSGFCRAQS